MTRIDAYTHILTESFFTDLKETYGVGELAGSPDWLWDVERREQDMADFMAEEMGFRTNERFQSEDGTFWGWWMATTALPHDIGIHRNDDGPSFHHVSYHVDHLRDLWDAADICREHGIAPDGGPGKHAITNADFFYVVEPASGIRIELFAGPGYLNFEPDWETIDWQKGEIGTELDHQWIGTQYSEASIPYV